MTTTTPLTDEELAEIDRLWGGHQTYVRDMLSEIRRLRAMKCASCGKRIGYINHKGHLLGWGCADGEECKQGLPYRFDTERGEVLVEDSWFKVDDLPDILGNFMRAAADHGREAKKHAMEVQRLRAENTALAAKVAAVQALGQSWRDAVPAIRLEIDGIPQLPFQTNTINKCGRELLAALGETGGTDAG
jgi:hypothetical protein